MGGSVNVAIRLSDGRVFSGEAWTNNQPWIAQTVALSDTPDAFLLEYIDARMNGPSKIDAPFGEGGDYIYPDGYGLIVYDVTMKTIFTMQSYTSFTSVHSFYEWIGDDLDEYDRKERDEFAEYYAAGRLYLDIKHRVVGPQGRVVIGEERQDATSGLSFNEFLQTAREIVYRDAIPNAHAELLLDIAPWTIEDFMRGFSEKRKAFRERLLEAGFTLNLAAEKGWQKPKDDGE